jgi:hypothetical protein
MRRGQPVSDRPSSFLLSAYLADAAGPVNLVLDLRLTHERFGSSSNPSLNSHLHYPAPADIDKLLNEAATDKIRYYRAGYTTPTPFSHEA